MLHTVAKLHYEAEMSQIAIARQLGLSTATISRMLQRARAEGIVRIEVRDLSAPDTLGAVLAQRLGLRIASVIEAPPSGVQAALADPLAAMLLAEGLQPGAVLAIGWGRAVRAVLEVGLPPISGVLVVPATGGLQQQATHFQVNEFVRTAAASMDGVPHFIHAPYLPSSPETREAFLADSAIRSSVDLWDRIDAAIVGVGLPWAINPPEASVATLDEQRLLQAAGDVIRHYFDENGALVDWSGEQRMIAASCAQLRKAALCVGVAADPSKAKAIIGASRAKLINALVTDVRTAEAVLDLLPATE